MYWEPKSRVEAERLREAAWVYPVMREVLCAEGPLGSDGAVVGGGGGGGEEEGDVAGGSGGEKLGVGGAERVQSEGRTRRGCKGVSGRRCLVGRGEVWEGLGGEVGDGDGGGGGGAGGGLDAEVEARGG